MIRSPFKVLCVLALGLGLSAPVHAQVSVPVDAPAASVPYEEGGAALDADPEPGPPPPLAEKSDPNSRTGESAMEPGENSGIPKSLRGSGQKAGGPANDLNPSGQAEASSGPAPDLAKVVQGQELFHGNYCGKGNRGEGLAPVDALDAACQRHDACYDAAGRASCACDKVLAREASRVSESPKVTLAVRRKALSVAEAAGVMECTTP